MAYLYKQLKPRGSVIIIHYAPSAFLRVVDSLRHNHAFSRVTPRVFLVNWATIAAPIVNQNLRFEDSLRWITFIQN